jgi:hypothetical protein
MADNSTSPGHATRTVATTRGILTYAQLAPLLAERVLVVEEQIAAGAFDGIPLRWTQSFFSNCTNRSPATWCPIGRDAGARLP